MRMLEGIEDRHIKLTRHEKGCPTI